MSTPNDSCVDKVKTDEEIEKKQNKTANLPYSNSKLFLIKILMIVKIIKIVLIIKVIIITINNNNHNKSLWL